MISRILGPVAPALGSVTLGALSIHAALAAHAGASVRMQHVAIKGYAFKPAALTVTAGTTVVWTNRDRAVHTVTFDAAKGAKGSAVIGAGKSFRFRFVHTGTFKYHCAFHAFMEGRIRVVRPRDAR